MKVAVLRAFFQPRIPVVLLVAGALALPLHAEDKDKPVAPPGYKLVSVKAGGKTGYIAVRDSNNPYDNLRDSGEGHGADHFSFSKTDPMADKTYIPDAGTSGGQGQGKYQDGIQSNFITKSYFAPGSDNGDHAMSNLDNSLPMKSADGYNRGADGYNTPYRTKSADGYGRASALGSLTASESHQSATLGGHAYQAFAYNDENKTYTGPEAAAIHRDVDRMNNGLETLKDLPDRPLTIDEVRALINHGVKPDLAQPAAAPSKPLNDPNYLPDAAPPPDAPAPAPDHLRDPNDLSIPGATAHPELAVPAPEDAEPLPNK